MTTRICRFNALRMMILFLLLASTATVQSQQIVTFGVYTSDKASTMYVTFNPVMNSLKAKLSENLGDTVDIKIKIFKTYGEGLAAIVNSDVDFMRMGPASYILAKQQNSNVSLLAMEIRKGTKRFRGVIIVPSTSEITLLSQLKGKRFAFGNKNSTIGRYLAQAALVDAGVHQKHLAKYAYLGRHDKVAFSVGLGDYDAGSVKEKTYLSALPDGKIRALHYFDNVTKPWVASPGIKMSIQTALTQALLSLDDKEALEKLKIDSLGSATDADYNFVRKGMEKAYMF